MTLIELLVVVSIAVMLLAIAIPVMRPALKDRKLREASRQINTFIVNAKARAAESGRPHGIWIVRNNDNTDLVDSSYQIFIAEVPPPFAGETLNARCVLTGAGTARFEQVQIIIQTDPLFVRQGDLIQFDYKGPKYPIRATDGTQLTFDLPAPSLGVSFPPATGQPVPFQIYRQPVRSSIAPLELPAGTCIDLQWSGIGYDGHEMYRGSPGAPDIKITFTPTGAVDRVYGFTTQLPGTIHLLVGRVDQVSNLQTDTTKQNLVDPTASWVSIGHLTGSVTTAENYYDPADGTAANVRKARTIAQQKQTMGGR
jgi:hypothetical protein